MLPVWGAAENWVCPNCGQTDNDGNFCPQCGAARSVEPDLELIDGNVSVIPGERDWVMVNILRIDGSDYVKAKKDKYQYAPWQATDEDASTCWQFTAKKNKEEMGWLSLILEGETVDGIWIRNGYQTYDSKGKYQYSEYARPKEIRVMFGYMDDEKENEIMSFTLSDEIGSGWEKLDTGRHADVYDVWILIDSIYKGASKSNTVCLSELMLVQRVPIEGINNLDE